MTFGLGIRCSIQLSYEGKIVIQSSIQAYKRNRHLIPDTQPLTIRRRYDSRLHLVNREDARVPHNLLTAFGEKKSLRGWARDERCKVSAPALLKRIKAGWKLEQAISEPATKQKRSTKPKRPKKPTPTFPLFAHANGQWAKTISGEAVYFGPWSDPEAAQQAYFEYIGFEYIGTAEPKAKQVTVREVVNAFLTLKEDKVNAGTLAPRTLERYKTTTDTFTASVGLSKPFQAITEADLRYLYKQG